MAHVSKLRDEGRRVVVPADEAQHVVARILRRAGCTEETVREVALHLVDASLSGVESHGVLRVLQYDEQFRAGYMSPTARPRLVSSTRGAECIDGCGGIGIPAMTMAVEQAATRATANGIAALAVRNVGHTGRLGAFAEAGAGKGCLVIIIGGGGRHSWRQVAPYGGRKAVLPTNPYAMAMPGGERGPVVVDFATSMVAGGWLHAARSAGARLPDGAIIDAGGRPSTDPEAYFAGGAILPKGGPMGYGLAVMAEMICEAMLGPVTTEVNWLVMAIDTGRYRDPGAMHGVAEEILAELRACPPAEGFDRVEVPGERERERRAASLVTGLAVPEATWAQILTLAGNA